MDEEDSFIEVEQWDVTSLSSNDDEGSYGCDVKTENEDKKCNTTDDDTTCNNIIIINNNNTTISSLIGSNAGTDFSWVKDEDEAVVDDCSVCTNHITSNNEQEDDVSMVVEHPRTSITEHDTTTTTSRSTCTTTTIVVVANDPSMTNPHPPAVVPCSTITASSSISKSSSSTNPTDIDVISTDSSSSRTVVTNEEHNGTNVVVVESLDDNDVIVIDDDTTSTKSKMDDDNDDKKKEENKTFSDKHTSSSAPAVDSVDHVNIDNKDVVVVRDNDEDKPVSKGIHHKDTPSNNEDKDLSPVVVVPYDPTDLIMNEEDSTDSTCNNTTTSAALVLNEYDSNSKDSRSSSSSTVPMSVLSVVTSKSYGGNGGHAFDSGCISTSNGCTTIKKVIVNAGAVVDGITLEYNDSSKVFVTGGCGGSKESITLDKNEYITKVVVKYNAKIVQSLTFVTNNGKQLGPCGGTSQALFLFCNNNASSSKTVTLSGPQTDDSDTHKRNYILSGIKGRSGVYIDQIAFYWTPVIESTSNNPDCTLSHNLNTCNIPPRVENHGITLVNSSQLYGGRGGTFFYLCFHDETHCLQRITINAGNVVDGITVQMMKSKTNNNTNKTSSCTKHIGGNGGSLYSLVLKENEYINEVCVVFNNRLVQSLIFQTNLGNQLGPCGGSNSGRVLMCGIGGMIHNGGYRTVTLKAPSTKHMLIGIRGRAGVYLDAIGVSWGTNHQLKRPPTLKFMHQYVSKKGLTTYSRI